MALSFIGVMNHIEQTLQSRLSDRDLLTAFVNVYEDSPAPGVELENSLYREVVIKRLVQSDHLDYFRRSFLSARNSDDQPIPVYVAFQTPTFWDSNWGEFDSPRAYLMSQDASRLHPKLTLSEVPISFESLQLPKHFSFGENGDVILLPYAAGALLLNSGFNESFHFQKNSVASLKRTILELESYFLTEKLKFTVSSALPILESLEAFLNAQRYVSRGVVILLVVIIAVILGNQSLLEFREQQYLYALLRSFGTPFTLILCHDFLEKLLLSLAGFIGAVWLLPQGARLVKNLSIEADVFQLVLDSADIATIGLSLCVGVTISWLLVVAFSRKPIGLILS